MPAEPPTSTRVNGVGTDGTHEPTISYEKENVLFENRILGVMMANCATVPGVAMVLHWGCIEVRRTVV